MLCVWAVPPRASPHLASPSVPEAVADFYYAGAKRDMKFVVMLREPVARCVSSYWFKMPGQSGGSAQGFADAVASGIADRRVFERCAASRQAVHPGETAAARARLCYGDVPGGNDRLMGNHVDKGIYVDQLERWLSVFKNRRNYAIVTLEQMRADPVATYAQLCTFLGVPLTGAGGWPSRAALQARLARRENAGANADRAAIPNATLAALRAFYAPYNERLYALLGRRFEEWE